jgi:polyether ionophore transport system permease protein
MLLAGVVAGVTYGLATDDVGGKLPGVLAAAAVQLPAIWLFSAVTVALFGLASRLTPVAWGVLVAVIALYFLGSVAGTPQWLLDLTPYAHLPHVPGEPFRAAPLVWLLIVDAVLFVVGFAGFHRRDLR